MENHGRTHLETELVRMHKENTPQTAEEYVEVVRQYWAPFNCDNSCVGLDRTDPYGGAELDEPPYGAITFVEDEPIVGIEVIGSACVPPGLVQVFAEPLEWKYPRTGVKMTADGLRGEHLPKNLHAAGIEEGWGMGGLNCTRFDLRESKRVTIVAGGALHMAEQDSSNMRDDAQHRIRIVRACPAAAEVRFGGKGAVRSSKT